MPDKYCNYNKKNTFSNCFWLFFELTGTGTEWLDIGLPTPTLFIKTPFGAYVAYAIEGFFATEKNKKFLADIFIRLKLSFANENASIRIIPYPPNLDNLPDYAILIEKVYNLRDDIAPALVSISRTMQNQEENLQVARILNERKITDDALFDYMRFIAYDFVKTNGKEALTREYLEQIGEIGNEVLGKTKEFSTIRAKAKSIYNWIMENYQIKEIKKDYQDYKQIKKINNWNYKRKLTDEEYEMEKKEIALRNAKMRAEQTKSKVYEAIEELKKRGEKVTVRKIKELAKVSMNSATKYLKQAREEGIV
jgi:Fic family protein